MFEVYIEPEEVWEYYSKNKKALRSRLDIIAEVKGEDNTPIISVCLTEEDGLLQVLIESSSEDNVLTTEGIISKEDCVTTITKFFEIAESCDIEKQYKPDNSDLEIVAERDFEILEAFKSFLCVLMGYEPNEIDDCELFDDEELLEVLPYVEETVYECGYVPYHPQLIKNSDGSYRFIELPYEDENF